MDKQATSPLPNSLRSTLLDTERMNRDRRHFRNTVRHAELIAILEQALEMFHVDDFKDVEDDVQSNA
jgi:hypothetical protein